MHHCTEAVPLFRGLSEDDILEIEGLLHEKTFGKGETLYEMESPSLLIIASGSLVVYQLAQNGRQQLLRIAGLGDYVGENILFGAGNENVYVEAREETKVCLLTQKDFRNLLLAKPELSLKLLEMSARRMKDLEDQARFLLMEDVEERLSTWLLAHAGGKKEITIPMKWKDLAEYLGTTPETLSRKLRKMEDEGAIRKLGRKVTIVDEGKLGK
jgi:CRP/FNR family transcriptional regulator